MEKTIWTKEQMEAIYDKGCNLLVAAGAGAGKTAVLVERIIQKIIDEKSPVDIDKLLVVTFTNAAAAEMRERIGDAIAKELEMNPESKRLQRQLTLLSRANVMTIHSFCLSVIRSNFHLIDIEPNFRVCDETEAILLKQETMNELFEDKFDLEDEGFINLIKCFGEKDDIKVQNIISNLYRFAVSAPWPEKWLLDIAEDFNVTKEFEFGRSKWADIIIHHIQLELEGCLDKMTKALGVINENKELEFYTESFEVELNTVVNLLNCNSWEDLSEGFHRVEFRRLPSKKLDVETSALKDKVKDIRDSVKKKIQAISEDLFSYNTCATENIIEMYPVLKTLSTVTIEFNQRFSSKKREKGIIDFNDIEHFALDILTEKDFNKTGGVDPSEIAQIYKNRFEEILIDEYQDSNLVQEVIMNMISKNEYGNVFMVGDVKQSIYRFRHAKPELFLKKYNDYGDVIAEPGKKIKLFKNFRSRTEVIDGVNFVFSRIMSKNLGELEYNQEEMLQAAAIYPDALNEIEIHLMDKKQEERTEEILEEVENEDEPDNIQLEARLVANRIKELLASNFNVFDKGINKCRNITYKDIVVLMRTTEGWAKIFLEELSNHDIPTFADTNTGYFDTLEIRTIMSLLQVIDNPLQDIPLISVLRSPIFSFSPEELIDIRMTDKEKHFFEMCKGMEVKDLDLRKKVEKFTEKINLWREKSLYVPIDEFIWYLYSETSYYSFVGTLPQGVIRQANLRLLFQRAKEYESTSYKGLFNFINYINKLKSSSGDMGSAKILGENENVVRIMSIHKSKGLEFPVVFLSGTGKKFNLMDMNSSILFHQELGYGPDYVNYERRIYYPTLVKQVIKSKIKVETLSEEMRILYVAFTRAKEKLIITGMARDLKSNFIKWKDIADDTQDKLPEHYILNAKCYLDWIVGAVSNNSKWNIKVWNKSDIFVGSKASDQINFQEIIQDENCILCSSEKGKEVNRRLDWKYKFIKLGSIPAKISVSELKNSKEIYKATLKTPSFLHENKAITAAEKGTILHLVMQHLKLDKVFSVEEIEYQIGELVVRDFLTQEEAKTVNTRKIYNFFKSDIGTRLAASSNIKREIPFFIEMEATDVFSELSKEVYSGENVVLQGIIDCYFEEGENLVLIDYKTDYVEESEAAVERYKKQLELYAKALEKITGKTVKNRYLYLFSNEKLVNI